MAYPKPIQKLIDLFTRLPGIGPRQAARFVFFILRENGNFLPELLGALHNLQKDIGFCTQCFRSMETHTTALCAFCREDGRDPTLLAVIEKESDMHNLEKAAAFRGQYHVLGGVISPLDQDSPKKIHLKEFFLRVKDNLERHGKCEVILATNPTAEGDMTAQYIERVLAPLGEKFSNFKISRLGRGLSLGSELEHVDEITLKNALVNRK